MENIKEIEITYYEDEINEKCGLRRLQDKDKDKDYTSPAFESIFDMNGIKHGEKYVRLFRKWLMEEEPYRATGCKGCQCRTSCNPPYNDPDNECVVFCSYYNELCQFLNRQEESFFKEDTKKYTYEVAPANCSKCKLNKQDKQYKEYKPEIIVSYGGNEVLRLKSDQLGFTVSKEKEKYDRHPYGCLWHGIKGRELCEKLRVAEFIATCILQTRTLGGGFLWPKEIWNEYNEIKGGSTLGGSYLQDRVDLTLLEIKHLFEWMEMWKKIDECTERELSHNEINEVKKEAETTYKILRAQTNDKCDVLSEKVHQIITSDRNESNSIPAGIQWLRHFGTFENYVEFFCFEGFVVDVGIGQKENKKNYMPIDIVESNLEPIVDPSVRKVQTGQDSWKVEIIKEPTKYKEKTRWGLYRKESKDPEDPKPLNCEDWERILKNVANLTLARSYRMQAVINGTGECEENKKNQEHQEKCPIDIPWSKI